MAGKSNKSKAKRAVQSSAANSTESAAQAEALPAVLVPPPVTASTPDNGTVEAVDSAVPEANQVSPPVAKADDGESQVASNDSQPKQG